MSTCCFCLSQFNVLGGELASCVHKFLAHGDPQVTSLVHKLLVSVCHPMYIMLCRWLLDGIYIV